MKISNEAKVGILIIGVAGLLALLTIKTGDFNFSDEGFYVKVRFTNIDGVTLNAPVMLNGLEVGKVEDIKIVEEHGKTKLDLNVWVKGKTDIHNGAVAYVKNLGFLGEKYVGLSNGPTSQPLIAPGTVILGKDPADFDRLLLDGQEIADNVKDITGNLKKRLDVNKESIDRIVLNVDSITTNVDERLRVNEKKIDELMENLRRTAIHLDQFTYDLKVNPWKLLYRPKEKRQKSIEMLQQERGEL